MTPAKEPHSLEIRQSYTSPANTKLARAIYPIISFGTYDKFSAHRWALKLIASNPVNGEETAVCLVNFADMVEGVRAAYATNRDLTRTRYDEVCRIFKVWKAKQEAAAQAA
jgi:hypothetical protein